MMVSSKQAAGLEVLDECGEGLVGVLGVLAVGLDVLVRVPRIARRVVDLHHADALFNEAGGGETAASRGAFTVHLDGGLGLLADVEDVGRFGLHAVGRLHGADGGLELRIGFGGVGAVGLLLVERVELLDEVELLALLVEVELFVVDIGDQLVGVEVLLAGVSPRRRWPG